MLLLLRLASALDVQLGDGSLVAYDCATAACAEAFCLRHAIVDSDCAFDLLAATGDSDAMIKLTVAGLSSTYASSVESQRAVSQVLRRSAKLRDAGQYVVQPHWNLAFSGAGGDDVATVLRRFGHVYSRALGRVSVRPSSSAKIRLGLVSSWFCNSAIGRLCAGLVQHIDRTRFQVVVAHVRTGKGDVRRDFYTEDLIEAFADHVIELPLDLDAARQALAHFDVLVYTDIGMEPVSYALAFARLAPVQAVFWGHPTTSGVPDSVDYYLLMDGAEPDLAAPERYTEQLVRLDTLGAFYRKNESGQLDPAKTRADYATAAPKLPHRGTVYACPQHCLKYHPDFDAAIAGILDADPTAFVVVRNCSAQAPALADRLPQFATRLIQVPVLPLTEFVALFGAAHVALEPFPFGGSITTLDAFEAGTPVVARAPTDTQRPALTAALYRILGMTDCCVANDTVAYVDLALNIAHNHDFRASVRSRLDEHRGRLFEDHAAVREFEDFFARAVSLAARDSLLPQR